MVSMLITLIALIALVVVVYSFPKQSFVWTRATIKSAYGVTATGVSEARAFKAEYSALDEAAQGTSDTLTDEANRMADSFLDSTGATARNTANRSRLLAAQKDNKPFLETRIKVLTGKISVLTKKHAVLTDSEKDTLASYKVELIDAQSYLSAL